MALQRRPLSDNVAGMAMIKVTDEIRKAAAWLLTGHDGGKQKRRLLEAIANGERKLVDALWWRDAHRVAARVKLDKLEALADPERNSNENERTAAARKLAELKGRRPPGLGPSPPPLPGTREELEARRKGKPKREQPPRPAWRSLSASDADKEAELGAVLYRMFDASERLLYAGASRNELVRISRGSPWRREIANVTFEHFTSWDAAHKAEAVAILNENPLYNVRPDRRAMRKPALSDNVATPMSDNVARLRALNVKRAADRAAARAGRKCEVCGKLLQAQRPTARFCGPTCRSKAFRNRA
jgi:hypothetical protein